MTGPAAIKPILPAEIADIVDALSGDELTPEARVALEGLLRSNGLCVICGLPTDGDVCGGCMVFGKPKPELPLPNAWKPPALQDTRR